MPYIIAEHHSGTVLFLMSFCVKKRKMVMKYTKTLLTSLAFAATAVFSMQGSANAGSLVSGTLTCESEGSIGQIITSKKSLVCEFKPADTKTPADRYTGHIENYGLDLGVTGKTKMVWSVLAAAPNAYTPGALAGTYRGVGSSVSVAAGAGSQLLGAGPANGLTLQALSVDVHQGANLALGVTKMTLTSAEPTKHVTTHHKKAHKKASHHKKAAHHNKAHKTTHKAAHKTAAHHHKNSK